MDSLTTNAVSFPLFSLLPPELRIQIWRKPLPQHPAPSFFSFKKGCWQVRSLPESDAKEMGIGYDGTHLLQEFDTDRLDKVETDVPLFFVNREARSVAISWIHQHRIEMRSFIRDRKPILKFFRNFEGPEDALYVGSSRLDDLANEIDDMFFGDPDSGLLDRHVWHEFPIVKRIAIPEDIFDIDKSDGGGNSDNSIRPAILCEFLVQQHMQINELIIVLNNPHNSTSISTSHDLQIQPDWKLLNFEEGGISFRWQSNPAEMLVLGSIPVLNTKDYHCERVRKITDILIPAAAEEGLMPLTVRPVYIATDRASYEKLCGSITSGQLL